MYFVRQNPYKKCTAQHVKYTAILQHKLVTILLERSSFIRQSLQEWKLYNNHPRRKKILKTIITLLPSLLDN